MVLNEFLLIYNVRKGDDTMNIEIRPHNKIRDFIDHLCNRFEDMMFSVILHLPKWMITDSFMDLLDTYTTNRILRLQQQTIKQTWRNMYLEESVQEISANQAQKKHQ
jgi:hypothetical protein